MSTRAGPELSERTWSSQRQAWCSAAARSGQAFGKRGGEGVGGEAFDPEVCLSVRKWWL